METARRGVMPAPIVWSMREAGVLSPCEASTLEVGVSSLFRLVDAPSSCEPGRVLFATTEGVCGSLIGEARRCLMAVVESSLVALIPYVVE